ncbi:hypothetical protein D3C80_2126370 [compost metagenome]
MAEESQTFAAQNNARAAAFEEYQSEMTAKAQNAAQTPQASTHRAQAGLEKDS